MAALEYLTTNSLTAYPFKDRRRLGTINPYPIQDDWFYDIQFTSYVDSIRSVYVSRIAKELLSGAPSLEIEFSNAESSAVIDTVVLTGGDFVSHYKNNDKSFASQSIFNIYAVKIILGPGLPNYADFSQTYSSTEAQLVSSAIILRCPRVDTLTFNAYSTEFDLSGSLQYTVNTVATYNYSSISPVVQPRYNTEFMSEGENAGGLYVNSGFGAGLYDDCPVKGAITDVYSVSTVLPDDTGALFLTASSCYTVNALSENDAILLGSNDPSGFLYKYHTFQTNRTDVPIFDAVNPDHSIYLQNFCRPKCPPENLAAFAHYLNRVSDGAAELDRIASDNVEVRGTGQGDYTSGGDVVFTADSFCSDPSFYRCNDPEDPSYIACGTKFEKYFHEFRTLQLKYADPTLRSEFTIIEVFADNAVRLDARPTPTGSPIPFRVLDNGVVSNMNCAANAYNLTAATYTQPYFKVKYTTVESYNSQGQYVTFAAVNVAIFNPSRETAHLQVLFTADVLEQQGKFKIRTKDQILVMDTPAVSLGCLEYAFVEVIYSIGCGVPGGYLSVTVNQITEDTTTQLGDTYALPPIDGLACLDTVSGTTQTLRIAQSDEATYGLTATMPVAFSEALLYGEMPAWLSYTYPPYSTEVNFNVSARPTDNENKRYSFSIRLSGGAASGEISLVILDYVADPEVLYPLGGSYPETSPLLYSKDVTYTLESPIFEVKATNMTVLSADFPSDNAAFVYTLTRNGTDHSLPAGLVFDEVAGKLYGKLSPILETGNMQLVVGAQNASGPAANPQIINLATVTTVAPVISFVNPPLNNIYSASNIDSYSSLSPLLSINTTDAYSKGYTLIGTLPTGLSFNSVTGAITGKIKEASSGTSGSLAIYSSNGAGQSNTLSFSIVYTVLPSVAITYPNAGAVFTTDQDAEYSLNSPLFTVLGRQIDGTTDNSGDCTTDSTKIKYTAVRLPQGFDIDLCSGKVFGKFTGTPTPPITSFATLLTATNPTGVASTAITVKINSPVAFDIAFTSPTQDNIYVANSVATYTATTPLVSFTSLEESILNYTLTGSLPAGLVFIPATGKIVGTLSEISSGSSGELTVTAISLAGSSNALTFSISYTVYTPITITYPAYGAAFNLLADDEFTESAPLFEILGTQLDGSIDNSVDCTTDSNRTIYASSALPSGFTLNECTGKIFGKYTGEALQESASFPITVTASNPTGTAAVSVRIVINTAAAPIITGLIGQSTIMINKRFTYTESAPLLTLTGRNNPLTALSQDLPPGFHLSGFKVVGTAHLGDSGTYESIFRLVNDVTVSDPVSVNFKLPVSITSPPEGDEYITMIGDSVPPPYLIDITTSSVPMQYPVTVTTSQLPAGLLFADGKISGIPETEGTHPIKITAQADTYGKDEVNVFVTALVLGFNVTGTVKDTQNNPVPSAVISYGATKTTTTNNDGEYALYLPNGTYTIKVTKKNYLISPATPGGQLVTVNYAAVENVNFSAVGPVRKITGKITRVADSTNIQNIPISSSDGKTTTTNTLGEYTLYAEPNQEIVITPSSALFTFLPNYITVAQGADDAADNNFTGSGMVFIPAPNNIILTAGDKKFTAKFSQPTVIPPAHLDYYEFSLDDGITWLPTTTPGSTATFITITSWPKNTNPAAPLDNGTSYAFRLRGRNSVSGDIGLASSTRSIKPGAFPEAPEITSITSGDAKLTVNFTPGGDGGYPITGYSYSLDSGATYQAVDNPGGVVPTAQFDITGLTNGVTYFIKISANNEKGAGKSSAPVIAKPIGTPSAPTFALPVTPRDSAILVDFLVLSDGGDPLTAIQYTLDAYASTPTYYTVAADQTTSPIVITGLTNGTAYDLAIRAVNAQGFGAPSAVVAGVTPATLPASPSISQAIAGNKTITLTLTPGASGGSPITNYQYSLDNGVNWTTSLSPGGSSTSLNITKSTGGVTDLVNGETYTVYVRAQTAIGYSARSERVSVTPVAVPGKVEIFSTSISNNDLTIGFIPTSPEGSALLRYEYKYTRSGETESPSWISLPASTTQFTIPSLTPGADYTIKIRAVNDIGAGEISEIITADIEPPSNLAIYPGDKTILVSFDPPQDVTIAGYKYSLNNGSYLDVSSTNLPIVISEYPAGALLLNGNNYAVSVRGVDSAGNVILSASGRATPCTVPGTPRVLNNTASNKQITVVFNPPLNDGGSPVTGYKYSTNADSVSPTYIDTDSTTSPIRITKLSTDGITQLVNGTVYSVAIKAFNIAGAGQASPVASVTPVATPGAATISVLAGYQQLRVSIDVPAEDGGLSPISKYQYSLDGTTWLERTDAGTTNSPLIVTKTATGATLVNGTAYSVRIRAVNGIGAGATSNTVTLAPVNIPTAPTNVTASSVNSQISVQFIGANPRGTPISTYQYSLDGGATFYNAGTTANKFTITQVTPGPPSEPLVYESPYSLVVRAATTIPDIFGIPSSPVSVTVKIPSAPTNLAASPAAGGVNVRFSQTLAYGTVIAAYQYSLDGGTNFYSTNTKTIPITITEESPGVPIEFGKPYSLKIRALSTTNVTGNASAALPLTVIGIGAPTSVSAYILNNQIRVRFVPGALNGLTLANYQYSLDGGVTRYSAVGNLSPITIPYESPGVPLEFNKSYAVIIRGLATTGIPGAWSASATAIISGPTAPTALAVTANQGALTAQFTPGEVANKILAVYQYSLDGGTSFNDTNTSVSPINITQEAAGIPLSLSQDYSLLIRAKYTDNSTGPSSSIVSTFVLPAAPVITDTLVGDGTIIVTVSSISDPTSAITSYEYSTDNGTTWRTGSNNAGTITISSKSSDNTQLINETSYSVRVRALTAKGTGAASAFVSATPTTATPPNAPTNLTVKSVGDKTITIQFTTPNNNGRAITNYEYSVDTSPDTVGTYFTPFSPANTTTTKTLIKSNAAGVLADLVNFTNYYIQIRAVNITGAGAASATLIAKPLTIPTTPTITEIIPGGAGFTIMFTGGLGADKLSFSSNDGATWRAMDDASNAAYQEQWVLDEHGNITGVIVKNTSPPAGQQPSYFEAIVLDSDPVYQLKLKAVNALGSSAASNMVEARMYSLAAPKVTSVIYQNGDLSIAYSNPVNQYGSDVCPNFTTLPYDIFFDAFDCVFNIYLNGTLVASPAADVSYYDTTSSPLTVPADAIAGILNIGGPNTIRLQPIQRMYMSSDPAGLHLELYLAGQYQDYTYTQQ